MGINTTPSIPYSIRTTSTSSPPTWGYIARGSSGGDAFSGVGGSGTDTSFTDTLVFSGNAGNDTLTGGDGTTSSTGAPETTG